MKLKFTKMQGIGNDFIVIDAINQKISVNTNIILSLANRKLGIGADQILLVENSVNADFKYRIFNADGTEVENCGNGARCFIKFIHEKKLSNKNPICAEIKNGFIFIEKLANGMVKVDMGEIIFTPESLPFNNDELKFEKQFNETLWKIPLDLDDKNHNQISKELKISIAKIANPHAVILVDNVHNTNVDLLGKFLESHKRFPNHVNVGFMEIIDKFNIKLRVYERGAGETLACGTGACAAAVSGIRRGILSSPVTVHTNGGNLVIYWDGKILEMEGPAVTVFEGEIDIDQLAEI